MSRRRTGLWRHAAGPPRPQITLSGVRYGPDGEMDYPRRRGRGGEEAFPGYLRQARAILAARPVHLDAGPTGLTIARAFLASPPILILHEATSNVDTRIEILIQEAMSRLRQGRTSLVIAHRLSTIRNADTIIVMDAGHIVEQGNHADLLRRHGVYYSLYNSQFTEDLAEAS